MTTLTGKSQRVRTGLYRVQPGLYWTDQVALLMEENGIENRCQLATRLEGAGVDRNAVYRGFTEDWRGRVSEQLLFALAATFAVPPCEHCGWPSLIQLIQR